MTEDQILSIDDVLAAARNLLLRGWTTGELARDANGIRCDPLDEGAVCWCISGAIMRVLGTHDERCSPPYMRMQDLIPIRDVSVTAWNDSHTRAEVLALFDLALGGKKS